MSVTQPVSSVEGKHRHGHREGHILARAQIQMKINPLVSMLRCIAAAIATILLIPIAISQNFVASYEHTIPTAMPSKLYYASINGKPVSNPTVSTWDISFQRGLGVFEVVRILPGGVLKTPQLHWERMVASAEAVGVADILPPKQTMMKWMEMAAEGASASDGGTTSNINGGGQGEGYLRIIVTLGAEDPDNEMMAAAAPPNVYIMWYPLPKWPSTYTLMPQYAPWHVAGKGRGSDNHAVPKVTSYGPNVVSTRKAKKAGYTDALLLADSANTSSTDAELSQDLSQMIVLDGPSFAVGWLASATKLSGAQAAAASDSQTQTHTTYFPSSSQLGLLKSTTQQLLTEMVREKYGNWTIEEGAYSLQDMLDTATEVFVLSSTRGIIPVARVGDHEIGLGPIIPALQVALKAYMQTVSEAK